MAIDFSLFTHKTFNIAGPCNETEHYMLPALDHQPFPSSIASFTSLDFEDKMGVMMV